MNNEIYKEYYYLNTYNNLTRGSLLAVIDATDYEIEEVKEDLNKLGLSTSSLLFYKSLAKDTIPTHNKNDIKIRIEELEFINKYGKKDLLEFYENYNGIAAGKLNEFRKTLENKYDTSI